MSAAKLRAAAKSSAYRQKQVMKGANVGTKVVAYSAAWKKTFDCDQPISVDDAAFEYAA